MALVMLCLNTSVAQTYWQQQVDYKIDAQLNDQDHTISAYQTMVYTNNSPSTLNQIYIHLWANAYKNQTTAFAKQQLNNKSTKFYYAPESDLGYIDSLDFKVDGQKVEWNFIKDSIDICLIKLKKPLLSGQKITISTPFKVKFPADFSRMGHTGQAYQATQWYPKPAVFDANGWNYMPYLDQGEFYSEFGSFDVNITVPKNYVVGATGDLQNADEMAFLNRLAQKTEQKIADSSFTTDESFPVSDLEYKTLNYKIDRVHDFAWFADKRFNVLISKIKLPESGREVKTINYFIDAHSKTWKKSKIFLDSSVYYYSLWVGDYPYNICQAVDGALSAGGGMEYPTITVISAGNDDAKTLDLIIAHEVGHNWFYGILGSNERTFGWMDEGVNSYYEDRYVKARYPSTAQNFGLNINGFKPKIDLDKDIALEDIGIFLQERRGQSQPVDTKSYNFTSANYGLMMYKKTASILKYLAKYIGQQKFDDIMHQYYRDWQFKHPQPKDIKNVFDAGSKEDLTWFFSDMVTSIKPLDYAAKSVKPTANGYDLTLENKGGIAGGFYVSALDKQGIELDRQRVQGFEDKKTIAFNNKNIYKLKIENTAGLNEYNAQNNTIKIQGLFKKCLPLKLKFAAGIENSRSTQIYYAPILGFNKYDKFMLGLALYNNLIIPRDVEWFVAPMYAFGSKNLTGSAGIFYHKTLENKPSNLRQIRLGATISQFTHTYKESIIFDVPRLQNFNYQRFVPEIQFTFQKELNNPIKKTLLVRSVNINWDYYKTNNTTRAYTPVSVKTSTQQLTYTINRQTVLNPASVVFDLQVGINQPKNRQDVSPSDGSFGRLSITGKYRLSYDKKNKGLDARVFAGYMIFNTHESPIDNYRSPIDADFRMNSYTGLDDYLLDGLYFGRNENSATGFYAHQMQVQDGGFKILTPALAGGSYARTNRWLAALNLSTTLPGKRNPVQVFADGGLYPKGSYDSQSNSFTYKTTFLYDAGLSINLFRDVLVIYVPLIYSEAIAENVNSKFYQNISFSLNLKTLNPLKLARTINF